ncbi:uncharacterized protein LOC115305292 [Suricata suricatta]|uniref:uncharacterized protein LOC115305292 n=1 Tax=Suricata suricatta TaxID=37032 RepID=UPI001155400E|nr:uncharacterized protein LOC115305292 [Suricata suricatta]
MGRERVRGRGHAYSSSAALHAVMKIKSRCQGMNQKPPDVSCTVTLEGGGGQKEPPGPRLEHPNCCGTRAQAGPKARGKVAGGDRSKPPASRHVRGRVGRRADLRLALPSLLRDESDFLRFPLGAYHSRPPVQDGKPGAGKEVASLSGTRAKARWKPRKIPWGTLSQLRKLHLSNCPQMGAITALPGWRPHYLCAVLMTSLKGLTVQLDENGDASLHHDFLDHQK